MLEELELDGTEPGVDETLRDTEAELLLNDVAEVTGAEYDVDVEDIVAGGVHNRQVQAELTADGERSQLERSVGIAAGSVLTVVVYVEQKVLASAEKRGSLSSLRQLSPLHMGALVRIGGTYGEVDVAVPEAVLELPAQLYTSSLFPAPQYSFDVPSHNMLQSEGGARVLPLCRTLPQ